MRRNVAWTAADKRDAEQKYLEIEHMKRLELQYSNDSINHLKQQKYEREQSNGQ